MQQMFRSYKKVRIIYCVEMSLLVNGTCFWKGMLIMLHCIMYRAVEHLSYGHKLSDVGMSG